MTRDDFIARNPIVPTLESHGVKVTGSGNQRMAKCPFHEDKSASMSVNVDQGLWNCHAGCGGGSVIDLLAKFDARTPAQILIAANQDDRNGHRPVKFPKLPPKPTDEAAPLGEPVKTYPYLNAVGDEVYRVLRYEPKTFRQQHRKGNVWAWGMEGVERVLYRLPEVLKASEVWVVEGEKDADNLAALGFCATCNVGGAGKWLGPYSESLAGKDVVLCGDNDDPGQKHVKLVFDSVAKFAKTVRIVKVPEPHKDASDLIASQSAIDSETELKTLRDSAVQHIGGVRVPVFTMAEIEPLYRRVARFSADNSFSLSKWLPSLGIIRPLIPGEVALVVGDTGTGKTAILQNMAIAAAPLPTLFIEMELPAELLFERFVAAKIDMECREVERGYRQGSEIGYDDLVRTFPHLFIVTESKLKPLELETLIIRSELKMGRKPKVVMLDYVQLLSGTGKRYERTSDAAEVIKVVAKSTGTIIITASQVQRETGQGEIGIHSAKDSGSLENSAGLVFGAWRSKDDKTLLTLKVLKSTKGGAGLEIACNYDAPKMRITERSSIPDDAVPPREYRPPTND